MSGRPNNNSGGRLRAARPVFPFTAIVGQEEMKLALLLNVVAPSVGGVLVTGHRGTGKTTAVRALADLLPPLKAATGCAYNCDPSDDGALCDDCAARVAAGRGLKRERRPVPVVELPLGATEDRVCGTIDLARALKDGVKSFEPGLLARANRGFLYIDEVNLLEDHLVDVLLDVAATGRNRVEREGVSAEHPSRFVLIGSANPEEGELRPQLLDRFGLCVEVETVRDLDSRVLIIVNREAFDEDPAAFNSSREVEQARLRRRVLRAAGKYAGVKIPRAILRQVAELCERLGVDGHRGEITVTRAARALAALEGRGEVSGADVRRVAPLALRHRLRRDPLEQGGGGARVEKVADELFGRASDETKADGGRDGARSPETSRRNETTAAGASRADARAGSEEGARKNRRVELNADGRGDTDEHGREIVLAPIEGGLKGEAFAREPDAVQFRRRADTTSGRRRGGARNSVSAGRGRYTGASPSKLDSSSIALDATLRAAACGSMARTASAASSALRVAPEALRFKRFSGPAGVLFIFLVDTSGSMAANRIAQAKGALAQLLRRSYVNRDRVALVSFRGDGAELLLAPSGSAARARALLDVLPIGGATPLASGLLRALEVARRAVSEGSRRIRLVVFTDGRANVPLSAKTSGEGAERKEENGAQHKGRIRDEILALGASLVRMGVASLVVDTQGRFTAGGEGRFLSDALGGSYERLPQMFSEAALSETIDAGQNLR
ncbi:MAG: magnesium chelatase subunit [Acidobacteriota bacterium]|nr:magnesium chelatase subunit [Acidobacteriota bacterium]